MVINEFISIGENIHCTRMVKGGGIRTAKLADGGEGLKFSSGDTDRILAIPANWAEVSAPYADGKIRHITLAIHQALNGDADQRADGADYLKWAVDRQVQNGAHFIDINVDEYSTDPAERVEVMEWLAGFIAEYVKVPLCIDSSNVETLAAGLGRCSTDHAPMMNSVSLEREDAVDVAMQYKAHAIVSAAGKASLPTEIDERLANFRAIVAILDKAGMPRGNMHLDALVLPISVDAVNGRNFIEATARAKAEFEGVNLSGGLSNVSFGMPNRKLLNLVFTTLFVEAGGNGGIVDPLQISLESLRAFDMDSEPAKLARAVLDGTDMFGGEYIAAFREGRL